MHSDQMRMYGNKVIIRACIMDSEVAANSLARGKARGKAALVTRESGEVPSMVWLLQQLPVAAHAKGRQILCRFP